MSTETEYWDIRQVANFLGRAVGTLYNWHGKGIGPAYERDRLSRRIRYRADDVRAWADQINEPRTETLVGDSPRLAKALKETGR